MIDNKHQIFSILNSDEEADVFVTRDYLMTDNMIKVYKSSQEDFKTRITQVTERVKMMDEICTHSGILQMQVVSPIGTYDLRGSQIGVIRTIHEFPMYGNLGGLLAREGALDLDIVRYIMFQVWSAVDHLHSRNIAHMQLATQNLMVCSNFEIKLAKGEESQKCVIKTAEAPNMEPKVQRIVKNKFSGGSFNMKNIQKPCFVWNKIGWPGYTAPELGKDGEAYDALLADIYSLGGIMHELAYNSKVCPESCPWESHLMSETPEQPFWSSDELTSFKDILSQMLNEDAHKRPTIQEVLAHKFFQNDELLVLGRNKFESCFEQSLKALNM